MHTEEEAPQPEEEAEIEPGPPKSRRRLLKIIAVVVAIALAGVVAYVVFLSNAPPVAAFGFDAVDLHLTVRALNSTDPDGDALSGYQWDWGDGTALAAGVTQAHDYAREATYAVRLTVQDSRGASGSKTVSVVMRILPGAFFLARQDQMTTSFDASGSTPAPGHPAIQSYTWKFGDGTTGTGIKTSHTYQTAGRYTVNLTISDGISNGTASRFVSPASTTVDILYDRFFTSDCPYGDFWPLRKKTYGDVILANQAPCLDFYPWVLLAPDPAHNPSWVYTLYHLDARVRNHPGYSVAQPVFLPVFNYSVAPSADSYIFMNASFGYLGKNELTYWSNSIYHTNPSYSDGYGYLFRSNVTMDLQESKRIFGVGDPVPFSPSANFTSQWTNSRNAFASDDRFATDHVNGNLSEYGNYGIPQLPASAIQKVEVGVEGNTSGDDQVRVDFSTDGGVSWQTAGTATLGLTDGTTLFDITSLRTWTLDLLNNTNFRTRIVYVQVGATASRVYVDWVPAQVKTDSPSWWWVASTAPGNQTGPLEARYKSWLYNEGNGKYDAFNAFQYYFSTDVTDLNGTVDPVTGQTRVTMFLTGWGYDVLQARWFYWGNASYQAAVCQQGINTTFANCGATLPYGAIKPAGWSPMETCWCENATINATVRGTMNLDFQAVSEYQFDAWADPGPDGLTPSPDDIAAWAFQPTLMDYVPPSGAPTTAASKFPNSELRWYEGLRSVHLSPGSYQYGQPYEYMTVPARWNLSTGNSLTIVLPKFPIPWVDPVRSSWDPIAKIGHYVLYNATLTLGSITPAGSYALWDPRGKVISIAGPWDWGATGLPTSSSPSIELVPEGTG